MLFRQDLRRRHDRRLMTILTGGDHSSHGYRRFSATDIPLQQAVHAPDRHHVLFDFRDDALLGGGQGKGKQSVESPNHFPIGPEGNPLFDDLPPFS